MTEAMVSLFIFTLAMAAALWIFIALNRTYQVQKQFNDMQQNLFSCVDAIVRDARMPGYGFDIRYGTAADWIDWVPGVTGTVHITDGGGPSNPDALSVVAALEAPVGSLTQPTARGATLISVSSNALFALDNTVRKVIYVGKTETARIVNMSGNMLTISTHPTRTGHGLRYAYPAGSPVERVDVVTYACYPASSNVFNRPYLARSDNQGIITNEILTVTGLDIDDFQLSARASGVSVSLRARTRYPDRYYTHPVEGDHYRRKELTAIIEARNP